MARIRENEPIASWEESDLVQGFALIARAEVRVDRNGREYVDLELADASGRVSGKVWPDSPAMKGDPPIRGFAAYQGIVHRHKGDLQVNLDRYRAVTDDERRSADFDEGRLVPSAPVPLEELDARLRAVVPGSLEKEWARELAVRTLARHGDELRVHPAARSIHHAVRGGLLHHTVTMLELAVDVCARYPELDRDLVLLGLLFHDLGKTRELGALPDNDYTFEGELVGHVAIGHAMLRDLLGGLAVPETDRVHLEHLVLSHHGRREYGSPVEPATAEALVVSQLDALDSKLAQLREARERGERGLVFLRPLGRSVWLPD